jgi:hypothetical protein
MFSISMDIFYPSAGTVFSKEGVFQQPRLLTLDVRGVLLRSPILPNWRDNQLGISLTSGRGEPALASAGGANHDRHDRGCDHPARTHFDQEPVAAARSGDAPDEEGQTMVLRNESATRGR